jgi:hypothetical protein
MENNTTNSNININKTDTTVIYKKEPGLPGDAALRAQIYKMGFGHGRVSVHAIHDVDEGVRESFKKPDDPFFRIMRSVMRMKCTNI